MQAIERIGTHITYGQLLMSMAQVSGHSPGLLCVSELARLMPMLCGREMRYTQNGWKQWIS